MSEIPTIHALWTGCALAPVNRALALCRERLTEGRAYRVDIADEASAKSRAFYFARLNEMWSSLREPYCSQYPSAEILRKHCLVATGFANSRQFVAESPQEARRFAAFLRSRAFEDGDEAANYSVVSVHGRVITELTPRSQKQSAMDREEFNRSKDAVLSHVEIMLGISQ